MSETLAQLGYTFRKKDFPHNPTLTDIEVLFKGEIVGGIRLKRGVLEGVMDIPLLKVAALHRHKGIATELHRQALAAAAGEGLRLRTVQPLNPKLKPLWDKLKINRRATEGGEYKTGAGSEQE